MKPLELAVDALAVHRLARLVTADTITQPIRAEIIHHAYLAARRVEFPTPNQLAGMSDAELDQLPEVDPADPPKLAAFIRCYWCTGLWISGFVVAARRYCPRVWDPCARALALSSAAALTAGLER